MALDTLPEGERQAGRVEVLPVQWRKHLKLEVPSPPPAVAKVSRH